MSEVSGVGDRDGKGETNLSCAKGVELTGACGWLWGVREVGMTHGFLAG